MGNENLIRSRPSPAGHGAPQTILQGVKRQDWRARPEAARNVGLKLAGRGEIAYWVIPPDGPRLRNRARRATQTPAAAHAPALGQSARRRLPLLVRKPHLRPLSRRPAARARARHGAARPTRGAYRRDSRDSRGKRDLAARIDDRNPARRRRAAWRNAALRPARAGRALLRHSGLSPLTHSFFPRPEPSRREC